MLEDPQTVNTSMSVTGHSMIGGESSSPTGADPDSISTLPTNGSINSETIIELLEGFRNQTTEEDDDNDEIVPA